jgi:PAS domain S-box-containing protein
MSVPTILVVDDDAAKQLSLRAALEPLGHPIVSVDSGQAALRAVMEQTFAVILMDVQMQGMDGYETARFIRMREVCEHTPIVFITAFTLDEAQVPAAYASGAVDFIFAPIEPSILRARVSIFVDLFVNAEALAQTLRDVTLLSERSRDTEARTRTVLEHVADGIVTVNDAGVIESFNRAATRIFGYSEQEAIGLAFTALLAPEYRHLTPHDHTAELMGCRSDETTFPMELDLSDVRVGARTTHIGCIRDVSERRHAEQQLQDVARFFEMSHDMVCTADADGTFVELNGAWERTLGFTQAQLRAEPFIAFVHPDDVECTANEFSGCPRGRTRTCSSTASGPPTVVGGGWSGRRRLTLTRASSTPRRATSPSASRPRIACARPTRSPRRRATRRSRRRA